MPTSNVIKSSCVDVLKPYGTASVRRMWVVVPIRLPRMFSLIGSASLRDRAGISVESDGAGVCAVAVRNPIRPVVVHVDYVTRFRRGGHDDLSGLTWEVVVVGLTLEVDRRALRAEYETRAGA